MTGIDSYSPTPINNETVDGTTTWKEHQLPSTVNNSLRRILADIREQFNDFPWFQYGTGDQDTSTHLAVPSIYASGTSFTITGADVTEVYHASRRVRAIGSGTGTIYGSITSSSYHVGSDTTTVNMAWDSGSLQNETLLICISLIPGIGFPAQNAAPRIVEIPVTTSDGDALTTGNGKRYHRINVLVNGWRLSAVAASLSTVSSSGAVTIQIRRVRAGVSADMLSTPLTIDEGEKDSSAATPAVVDTANDDVATADQIFIDIDGAGTGAKGLNVQLTWVPV